MKINIPVAVAVPPAILCQDPQIGKRTLRNQPHLLRKKPAQYYLQRDRYAVAPHPPKGEAEAPESDVRPPDVLWTSLHAGRCRPTLLAPLKSVVGGAVAIWDIAELTSAQRAKRSRTEARDIALRTKEIVDLIADAVPDPSEIPPSMLLSIDGFILINSSPSSALDEIRCGMEAIELSGSLSCLVHLNRHDRTIQGIKTRLDAEYRDFLAASALRVEVQQAANALIQAQMQSEIKMVSASTFFWLAPDVLAVPHLCIGIGSPVRYA
ncbi:hypothetical protein C8J57DRAFT_1484861 [Mycena rebaudengoi]|nr:hypothetical protein C8J57DRAFT_1484861 [Mycena rebaudengoi]